MNSRIEKLIPRAIRAAERHLANNGVIQAEYNGYISSFGAAILQSGLKAAIAFNENTSSATKEDKRPLMKALLEIVRDEEIDRDSGDTLLEYVLTDGHDTPETKERIIDAVTALKLAIRTFKLERGED